MRAFRLLVLLTLTIPVACRRPEAPTGDDLDKLRRALDAAEQADPLARLGCAALGEPERGYCTEGLDAVAEVSRVGRPLLEAAATCREKGDVECVTASLETARGLLRKLGDLRGGAPAASSSPAPSASQ